MMWLQLLALWAGGAYVADVLVRPMQVAAEARAFARATGKPLLNVGAGTPGTSLRTCVWGPTTWGDVNVDIAAPRDVPHGPGAVSYGDAERLPFADKAFGAVIASHVVEHTERPAAVLAELERVADRSFVIVPRWWAAHTWAHPGHRWFISDAGAEGRRAFVPLFSA